MFYWYHITWALFALGAWSLWFSGIRYQVHSSAVKCISSLSQHVDFLVLQSSFAHEKTWLAPNALAIFRAATSSPPWIWSTVLHQQLDLLEFALLFRQWQIYSSVHLWPPCIDWCVASISTIFIFSACFALIAFHCFALLTRLVPGWMICL